MPPVFRTPAPALRGLVSGYAGFEETTPSPLRRREGPGTDIVVVISFEHQWLIDDVPFTSFAGGFYDRQVTTEHAGRSCGLQINLAPTAARSLFRIPMHELAGLAVPLDDVLGERDLADRLAAASDWSSRFDLVDSMLARRFADAEPVSGEVDWAWRRLLETHGQVGVGALAADLGWSRKRIAARFREHVGVPPKTAARIMRFERARELVAGSERPDWARVAAEAGYYDQSHLTHEFRAVTGLTPATFFQDSELAAA